MNKGIDASIQDLAQILLVKQTVITCYADSNFIHEELGNGLV